MDEVKIDVSDLVKRAETDARRSLENGIERISRSIVANLFHDGRYMGKEGLAHELIRKKIEDYVLTDEYAEKIDKIIIDVVDDESTRAVRALINSKSRKHLFQPTSPQSEIEKEEP